jgi:hypothetical protein
MTKKTSTLQLNWITLSALCLLCIAACLRFTSLANLPGINADEADMGVRILQMLHGQPYSLRSNTGQVFNPLFVLSEFILLKYFPQNFFLLRLPAAIFAMSGIFVLMYLYAKFFLDKVTALLLGAFVACFPLHMIFSRLGWDPTFLLFWIPIDLLLVMRLINRPRAIDGIALLFSSALTLWTHATAAIFLLAMLGALFWVQRQSLSQWLQSRLPPRLKPLAGNGTLLFALSIFSGLILAAICWYVLARAFVQIAVLTPHFALRVLNFPGSLAMHLRIPGDILTSYRGFCYVAGIPDSPSLKAIGWISEAILFLGCFKLARSKLPFDRFLAILLPSYFLLILLSAGLLQLFILEHQRYLVPMMVLLPLVIFLLVISAAMLGEYWTCFEQPALECRYLHNTQPTYWTGLQEPKAHAAKLILHLASLNPETCVVYTDHYWLERPLEFLLFGHIAVRNHIPVVDELKPGDFIASYTSEDLTDRVSSQLSAQSRSFKTYTISNQSGMPQIIVLQITPSKNSE